MKTCRLTFLTAVLLTTTIQADTFGVGDLQFTIDFVNIGNANNPPDTTGYGAVPGNYRIGEHEITIDQFTKADTATMLGNRIGDGNENYWNDGTRTVVNGPASYVTWYEAAKFCN